MKLDSFQYKAWSGNQKIDSALPVPVWLASAACRPQTEHTDE
jgi:hypothetical protein